jgi:hypothetical protein
MAFEKNLSEQRIEQLKLTKEITKYEDFLKAFKNIAFSNFEWCPISWYDFNILIATTKNDEVIFYRVQRNGVVSQLKCTKIEQFSKNRFKWISVNDEHYLIVGTSKGNLIRYSVDLTKEGIINGIEKVDEITGKVKLPIINIAVDYLEDNSTIVLCSKNHSLEIFELNETESKLILSKHIDLTITGVEVCNNFEYLMSTLNANVFFLQLHRSTETGEILLRSCENMDIIGIKSESEKSANDNFFGICTSRNNVFVYIACYPQTVSYDLLFFSLSHTHSFFSSQPYDHLVNKQPLRITINLFNTVDPFEMLMNNQSLKLTDYSDCVEAVRFIGSSKLEALGVLERMDYNIELSDVFAYYLKIQLCVVKAKIIFYTTRSSKAVDDINETKDFIIEIISVVHFYKLLSYLLKVKNPSKVHCRVIRAAANFIRAYCNSKIEQEPFKTAAIEFRPALEKLLVSSGEIIKKAKLPSETCECCESDITQNSLECNLKHRMKRCIVTNCIVDLDCSNGCHQCKVSVTHLKVLIPVLEKPQGASKLYFCPLCDTQLVFCE